MFIEMKTKKNERKQKYQNEKSIDIFVVDDSFKHTFGKSKSKTVSK